MLALLNRVQDLFGLFAYQWQTKNAMSQYMWNDWKNEYFLCNNFYVIILRVIIIY